MRGRRSPTELSLLCGWAVLAWADSASPVLLSCASPVSGLQASALLGCLPPGGLASAPLVVSEPLRSAGHSGHTDHQMSPT